MNNHEYDFIVGNKDKDDKSFADKTMIIKKDTHIESDIEGSSDTIPTKLPRLPSGTK